MATKFIHAASVGSHADPSATSSFIERYHAGQAVRILEESGDWVKVISIDAPSGIEGWVPAFALRDSLGAPVDRFIEHAGAQHRFFRFGKAKESDAEMCARIKEMWKVIDSDPHSCTREPWSAAYISSVAKRANLGKKFPVSGRHASYISKFFEAKKHNDDTFAFWALPLNAELARVGDMIGQWRTGKDCGNGAITYDMLPADFCGHVDIVVAVQSTQLITLGGNVADSVTETDVPLDANRLIKAARGRFTLLARRF